MFFEGRGNPRAGLVKLPVPEAAPVVQQNVASLADLSLQKLSRQSFNLPSVTMMEACLKSPRTRDSALATILEIASSLTPLIPARRSGTSEAEYFDLKTRKDAWEPWDLDADSVMYGVVKKLVSAVGVNKLLWKLLDDERHVELVAEIFARFWIVLGDKCFPNFCSLCAPGESLFLQKTVMAAEPSSWAHLLARKYVALVATEKQKVHMFVANMHQLVNPYNPSTDTVHYTLKQFYMSVVGRLVNKAFQNESPWHKLPIARYLVQMVEFLLCDTAGSAEEALARLAPHVRRLCVWMEPPTEDDNSEDAKYRRRRRNHLQECEGFLKAPREKTVEQVHVDLNQQVHFNQDLECVTKPPPAIETGKKRKLEEEASQETVPDGPSLDDFLRGRVVARQDGCVRCEVARGPDSKVRSRYGSTEECGGARVPDRHLRMRSCVLKEHSISLCDVVKVVGHHPEGDAMGPMRRRQKALAFMKDEFGVEPLGPDQRDVTLWTLNKDGAYKVAEGTSSWKKHRCVFMGFQLA